MKSTPGGIFETPVGLDPDFWSQENLDFGSDQSPIELGLWVWPESQFGTSPSTEKLRPQSLKWTGFLVGESPDHVFWDMHHGFLTPQAYLCSTSLSYQSDNNLQGPGQVGLYMYMSIFPKALKSMIFHW